MIAGQMERCASILITVLGYHEVSALANDGNKVAVLCPDDNDRVYSIEKTKFESIVPLLPKNKELKESLWKSFVKRDRRAIEKLYTIIT